MIVGGVVAQAGHVIADRYRLEERIGSGAMGVVWRAHDQLLRRTVAVKQLLVQSGVDDEEASARAMREGRIAARLQHPNAVTVYDAADVDGSPWLVMEFVPAPSLAAVLAQRGKLGSGEVIRLGAQIASALATAHANGIVHRDVKPGNVLLAEDGTAKITDFGISRANNEAVLTATGLVCGTPAYLAPEVAKGEEPNPASDVFALGSTLYTAVEGEPPFGFGDNTLALLHIVAAGQIRPLTVTGPLAPILTGMLAADPADRPTMAQARAQLVKAAGDITTVRVVEQQAQANADELVTARVTNQPPAALPPAAPAPMPRIRDSRTRVTRTDERRRGSAGLIATICVVVLLVVVTGILATRALNQPHGGNAGGSHSSSGSTTPNVPEVGVDPAAKLDYSHMRVALNNYYALLPGDPNDAFDLLSPGYQKKTGFQNFVKFYAGINQVTVRDILPLGPGNVSGVVTFVKEGGGTTHELYHFTFTIDHDKLLMSNAVRVGGQ
ncbi:MAG TPA: serine/threonine-protein kinase [Pseudonocardiaceae bacterium]|nr:serine/threonine-protein kinase [Pseudonocardiaceae bacterium]